MECQVAIDMVREGHSIAEAARATKIWYSTLWRAWQKEKKKPNGNKKR
jgi:DNA invertase Pin-like site-specific DNA recombinase